MAKIQELLSERNEIIDIKNILKDNPWIAKKNQKCILSPDSDGLLCGLFLSHYLDWEVIGFYDGKVALIEDGYSFFDEDVCFIDVEIYREGIKSIGHHMVSVYNNELPDDWSLKFKNCIQPNLMRAYDKNNFRLKYPLATIHLLIAILEDEIAIDVTETAIFPLLFTDGTYKVMFSYPENVMNWWKYLQVQDNSKLLNNVFMGKTYTVFKLMLEMDIFFRERDEISIPRERGDRLKISNRDSSTYNIEKVGYMWQINVDAKERVLKFLNLLSKHTGWKIDEELWHFDNLNLLRFTKSDFQARNWTIKKDNWKKLLELNPLSWAMTSTNNIEFTIEEPDKLF